jgi:hypothetical protein
MKQKDLYNLQALRKQPEFILTQLQNELYRELTIYMERNALSKKQLAEKLGEIHVELFYEVVERQVLGHNHA